jgi:hypothetical protein
MRESFQKIVDYLCSARPGSIEDQFINIRETIVTEDINSSPPHHFGRQGLVSSDNAAYLLTDKGVPSNINGSVISRTTPKIQSVTISATNATSCVVTIQEHNKTTFTDIRDVVLNGTSVVYVPPLSALTKGKELAVKMKSGSARDIEVTVIVEGQTPV